MPSSLSPTVTAVVSSSPPLLALLTAHHRSGRRVVVHAREGEGGNVGPVPPVSPKQRPLVIKPLPTRGIAGCVVRESTRGRVAVAAAEIARWHTPRAVAGDVRTALLISTHDATRSA
jgi:hypothetical protein